ncbi:MAG: hypothetical protein WAM82_36135 [Thermoanaerobaculia bacterium]
MPVIDNAEGPIFTPDAVILPTYAVMLYPRNEDGRRRWYAAAMAREYAICQDAGAPQKVLSDFHPWIPDLWKLRLSPERTYRDGLAKIPRGGSSGYMLLHLLRTASHHPRHCKVERIKALLVEFSGRFGTPTSESLLEKSWAEFKNVSHLWLSLAQHENRDDVLGSWLNFFQHAEAYRRAAEEARILDPAEAWKPEAHYLFRSEANLEPLDRDKLKFLDDMFPPL